MDNDNPLLAAHNRSSQPSVSEPQVLPPAEIVEKAALPMGNAFSFPSVGPAFFNSWQYSDRKPYADVPFSSLRRLATIYPIARACINRRITQITGLDWDITTVDDIESEEGYESQIAAVREFFKHPLGHKTRMRELLTMICDDTLTVDAISFEYRRTRGGQLLHLIPVDPTTIVLRVNEWGGVPEPPEVAYEQIIAGHKVASFTTRELLYDALATKSYTPYGMAPLESLILQVHSALLGTLHNLNYLKENNVPEGFLTLPNELTPTKELVEQWQLWFDAMVAGDARYTHRLKILPGGAEYTPAKKPDDMAFEKFELWLLQQTCAVFAVPPQDIGITYQVNKATGESQENLSRERGLIPLANFIREIINDVIQEELGFTSLQFMWRNINPVDRKEEAEIAEKEIQMGTLSVDEYRISKGLPPIGVKHYVKDGKSIVLTDDIVSGKYLEQPDKEEKPDKKEKEMEEEDEEKEAIMDIVRWRKAVYADFKNGRPVRVHFPSKFISKTIHDDIADSLKDCHSKFQAQLVFDKYLDPELRASLNLLDYAQKLRKEAKNAAQSISGAFN